MAFTHKPWKTEGDRFDFADDATGLQCAMRRGPGGHWCGYVGLAAGHPLYGKSYSDTLKAPDGWPNQNAKMDEDFGAVALFCAPAVSSPSEGIWPLDLMLRCHGGLTYSEKGLLARSADDLWWFGFDCAHSGDLCPTYAEQYSAFGANGETYRDADYVRGQIAKLCGDIATLADAISERDKPQ